jgi:phosphate:Na+ symporter
MLMATETLSGSEVAQIAIGLAGGLALFLFGMDQMTEALKSVAGAGMKTLLGKLTKNRFSGATTGAIVTAVVQSSSVTTVLVVGFVTAGVMTLAQSVGVIMGANIGTTITAQIVAFKVTKYALVLVAVGFFAQSFGRFDKAREYGGMIMGLGLIFFGMELMSKATDPLRTYDPFIDLMGRMDNPLLGILLAAAFTALVQSSSATTGIVIVLAAQGFISLEAGIALTLGANIGTCVTALLAAIGKPVEAVQAAIVHVLFNVIGCAIWVAFIPHLAEVVRDISPAYLDLTGADRLAAETPRQIANAHTAFNVANTLILIWFTGPIARVAQWIVPRRGTSTTEGVQPKYLDPAYLSTPALALERVQLEAVHLGERFIAMLEASYPAVTSGSAEDLTRIRELDDHVDDLEKAIVDYLRRLGREELSTNSTRRAQQLMAITIHFENAGDVVDANIAALGHDRIEHGVTISEETNATLKRLFDDVCVAYTEVTRALAENDLEAAAAVVAMKQQVDRTASDATLQVAERLLADEPNRIALFRIETDLIGQYRRLFYLAKRIAKTLAGDGVSVGS